ncbi:alpha/beta fold hydrolase [Pelagibius sp.]|uniref:alpha/beta fold hydrolase n=1 Tax=Pelagibius sp. TaxID=1931238 RepID=UPI002607EA9D|nr:alpha/beta hydrolase [Pelagibius sp.]
MTVRGAPSGRDAGDAVEAESLDLTVGDLRLAARWLRPANGLAEPAFVFLHEALGSIGQWKAFPERLAGACGLPGLIYERQGHGGSSAFDLPRENGYLRHEARQVLPAVLAAAGIERPVLVGHSDGATIALMFAAAFPEAVSACIVLAPHVMVEEITLAGIRAADAEPGASALRARLARHHGDKTEVLWRAWAETWLRPGFDGCEMRADLERITAPVLAIQGAGDAYGSPAQVEEIARRVSGPVEALLIPGCGHAPHLERQTEVLAAITESAAVLIRQR